MATVFYDRKFVFLVEFMEHDRTITAASYRMTFECLRRAIQNKSKGMFSTGIVLFHDNAWLYTAAATRNLLQRFRWTVFGHPPYSLDLAPSNY